MNVLRISELPARIGSRLEVDEADGHWLWTGWTNNFGYPFVRWEGRDQPTYRIVWTLLVAPIPDGLEIDHLCVTPRCCNPGHLEPVTHAENQRRIAERFGRCRRMGHDWSDPRNVYTRRNGRRWCAECSRIDQRLAWKERRRATT